VESLKELKNLRDIDISGTGIKVYSSENQSNQSQTEETEKAETTKKAKDTLEKTGDRDAEGKINLLPGKLEKIYAVKKKFISEQLDKHYIEEDNFCDIKSSRDEKPSQGAKIEPIIKVPLLSGGKSRYDLDRVIENYEVVKINYRGGKKVYPSDSDTGFE
jgi:hypothetical protein